jgi:hypothetical protein
MVAISRMCRHSRRKTYRDENPCRRRERAVS